MCGIAGILALSPGQDNTAAVRQMTAVLRHRGPDDEDYYDDDTLVDAIKTLIGQGYDAWGCMGERGRELVVEQRSWRSVAGRTLDAIEAVIG